MDIQWDNWVDELFNETRHIAQHYYKSANMAIETKSNQSVVTQADRDIERLIAGAVGQLNGYRILGEEFSANESLDGHVVVVDPIDSTANFVRGIPFFATTLAVVEDGVPLVGAVMEPISGDRWFAEVGKGAFKNGQVIHVSSCSSLDESLALHGSLSGREAQETPDSIWALLKQTPRQRNFGDYKNALMIAEGQADFALDFGLYVWDKAPLIPIVTEAGGLVTDRHNKQTLSNGDLIASNGYLHASLVGHF